ncbi:Crp/Fnr family transcriptional regulator [Chloroflexota bacterium]
MISSQILKEFKLFDGLDDSELAKIADFCHERNLRAGTICFMQGGDATEVHLCRSGKVDIIIQPYEPAGTEVKVHTIKAGEIFGWSSLMEPRNYTSSAKCAVMGEEVYIKGPDLLNLFEKNLHMGYVVMRNLSAIISSRLREDRQRLSKELSPDFQL